MRDVPSAALGLLRQFEGLRLRAYRCPAGRWTIGYGHTEHARGGQALTKSEAETLLLSDATETLLFIEKVVRVPLNDNQMAALICFVFNIGIGAFSSSTLLKKLNDGDYLSVPEELMRWVKVGEVTLPGLVKRRAAEVALWRGE